MDFADDVARMDVAWRVRFGVVVRLAYPAPHRGSHKGVPLRCAFGVPREDRRRGARGVPPGVWCPCALGIRLHAKQQCTRRGTPLWLPRCGVGYAKRTWAPRRPRWIPPP